jgi:hypothetical protein
VNISLFKYYLAIKVALLCRKLNRVEDEGLFNEKITEFSVAKDIEEYKRHKREELENDNILDNFFEERRPQTRSVILVRYKIYLEIIGLVWWNRSHHAWDIFNVLLFNLQKEI